MRHKTALAWTLIALGGGALVGCLFWGLPAFGAHAGSGAIAPQPLRCMPSADFAATYQVELEAKLRYDPARSLGVRSAGGPIVSDESLEGTLHMQAVAPRGDGELMMLKLVGLERVAPDGTRSALQGAWRAPLFAVLGRDCKFSSYGFAPDTPADVINRLQGLVQDLSMALGNSVAGASWSTREWDASGWYAAAYQRADAPRSFTKRRQRYLKPHTSAGAVRVQVIGSETHAALDGDFAWLEQLDAQERLRLDFGDTGVVTDVVLTTRLRRLDQSPAPEPLLAQAAEHLIWRRDSAAPLASAPRAVEPSPALEQASMDDVLLAFAAQVRSGNDLGAVHALEQYLRARPKEAQSLMARLARREIAPDLEPVVFNALELAGTPEAHAALLAGLSAQQTPQNRARAAAALPDIPHPDERTLEGLREASDGAVAHDSEETQWVRNAATLAIGTLEQRTRDNDPALAELSRRALRESLAQRGSNEERATVLAAIGNSGNPELVEDVEPFLSSKQPLLRSQSIGALRRMPLEATQELFAQRLEVETDPALRAKIAQTLGAQSRREGQALSAPLLASAVAQLAREQDSRARASLIELIGPACASSASAMRALAEQFAREPEPDLLQLIGRYVPANRLGS